MENTENNNIHKNQIFPLLKDIKALFISPIFIVSRNKIGLNRNKFENSNIMESKIPLSSYNFLMHPFIFPIFMILCLPVLVLYIRKNYIKTIHCRNLLSSILAINAKKYFFNDINIISDFRGHYCEEGEILGRWNQDSYPFRFWKRQEKKVLRLSNSCTFVSKSMKSYYANIFPSKNYFYAPAIVDVKSFYFCPKLRIQIRKKYNILDDEIVYIYTGSYGQWHDLELFYLMIENHLIDNSITNYRVFILSGQKSSNYSSYENKHNTQVINALPNEVNKYLCGADIGILPGTKETTHSFNLLYKTMISSKAEEYFCTGLQVLSNPRIGEVISLSNLNILNTVEQDRLVLGKFYQKMFSSNVVGDIYKNLYRND